MAGSSDYPTQVETFVERQDGVDIIQADDINDAYASIESVQTFVGASGAGQSYNIDILGWMAEKKPSMKISYVDEDTVQVSSGLCVTLNAGGSIRQVRQNTSTTNVTFANIDTGSRTSSTEYYIWADGDSAGTTVNFVISESDSAPTGVTNYRLIGGFYNNASDDIEESTVWSNAGVRIVGFKKFTDGDLASGTTTIPRDDTIPQDTEGDEYMHLNYAPQSTSNLLKIDVVFYSMNSADDYTHVALFTDASSDAIGAGTNRNNHAFNFSFTVYMTPSSLNNIRFAVRAGTTSSGTIYFNGRSGGTRIFGGVSASSITITEYEV